MDEPREVTATQPAPDDAAAGPEQPAGSIDVTGSSPEIVSDHTTDDLKIVMGEFDGPLDLLLHLIRQEQINIYDIPVARIADEYLRYLQVMQELDIAVAGDFLVMAATLIELKTRMLLPRDPFAAAEEEEDPRKDLVDQLLEYQKYKAAAQMLWSRATVERAVFKRAEIETDKNNPEVAVGLFDLLKVVPGDSRAAQRRSADGDRARRDFNGGDARAVEKHGDVRQVNSISVFSLNAPARAASWWLRFFQFWSWCVRLRLKLIQEQTFGDIVARVAS